jgi:phage shock protein PspC (stress-responsive transcriptional regulator)
MPPPTQESPLVSTDPHAPPPQWIPSTRPVTPPPRRQRLTRPRDNRWIGGVCSGLGRRFGLSPNFVRLVFVVSCLLPGPQFLIYLLLWVIIPGD